MELIFIYNADSGFFNALSDVAHKIISPSTYSCSLCKLTYGNVRMQKEWRKYLESLPLKKTFIHKDEFQNLKIQSPERLPSILLKDVDGNINELISADELNQTQTLASLIGLIQSRMDQYLK